MGHRLGYKPGTKIGYLGGGQLARMLAQSAQQMGCEAHILCPDATEPAPQVTTFWSQGKLDHAPALKKFFNSVDVVTFESEFIDPIILGKLSQELQKPVYPSPDLMGLIRDRLSQKTLLDNSKLPTSPWSEIQTWQDAEMFFTAHSKGVVFKKRLFGYDGYGTFVVNNPKELEEFRKQHYQDNIFIAEKKISFRRELAVILARSADGSMAHLPFVETQQTQSRCDWVKGPIKIREDKKLVKKLYKFLEKENYVGVMGVEFFEHKGELLINELAPRVHNSGHYSLDLPGHSQFDLHNLCLLGQKITSPKYLAAGFAMANLLGPEVAQADLKSVPGLTWYGKAESRPGRKMGHINTTGKSPQAALKEAIQLRKEFHK